MQSYRGTVRAALQCIREQIGGRYYENKSYYRIIISSNGSLWCKKAEVNIASKENPAEVIEVVEESTEVIEENSEVAEDEPEEGTLAYYERLEEDLRAYGMQIVESKDLTYDMLVNRNGATIVEKCIGVVLDEEGNGEVINGVPDYNYICYAGLEEDLQPGTVVLTYCVYNPDTTYEDDIILRYDFVIQE